MEQSLQQQINELETKVAFQEQTIEELNQQIIKLNDVADKQQYHLQLIITKLCAIEPSNMATDAEETPPPHY